VVQDISASQRAAFTLVAVLLAGGATSAYAQAPESGPSAPAPQGASADFAEDDEYAVSELVVVASRNTPQPGAVVGDIQPEIQLSPAQIQSYGVSSVADLLSELAPQISSSRGRGGGAPVVLLNGRRISGMGEIRDIPTEAIMRVDILPEEAALAYGFSADQRVVNFVLRRRFQATAAEVLGAGPTAGGQATGRVELNRIEIRGDNRVNMVLKAQSSSAITADERDVGDAVSARPFDLLGNITGATRGGEIDPALSALAGGPVTVAGLPAAVAQGQPLTLPGLAATAGVANAGDVGRYRTLVPETQTVTGNVVVARTLPNDFRGTLTANFSASRSDWMRGLPGASLTIPGTDPASPFAGDVTLNRYVEAFGPLRQTNESWSGQIGGSLNRDIAQWRLSLTGAYDHSDSFTRSDVGVDVGALQAAADGGTLASPFAAWPSALIAERGGNKARSVSDGVNLQFVASGPAFEVPAGPVRTSIKLGEAASWLSSDTLRLGVERSVDLSRNTLSAQGSVDVPLASRKNDVLPFLGDLSLNANAAIDELSDFGALTTVGFGVNWRPVTGVSLIVSHTRDEGAPSMSQLGGPQVVTEASRVFDYVTGRTVEVRPLDGGNAALVGDERNVTKVGLTWKPITGQDLTLSANYVRSRIDNPTASLPAVTAEIEAAFPDRFTRNADGDLIQIDYRPLNFAQTRTETLRWGFNYSRPWGPQPQRRFPGAGSGQAGGQGAGRAVAGSGASEAQRASSAERPDGGPPEGASAGASPGAERRPSAEGAQAQGGFGEGPRFGPGGPGGGGGPGGSGGPGRGFGPGPGGMGGRIQFAVYHTVNLENEILVREGGPVFDLLRGSAAGNGGGQPRHQIQAQAGISRNGMGGRLSANWQSATTVDAPPASPTGDLRFGSLATVDLRLFANLGQMQSLTRATPLFTNTRLTLLVNNVMNQRQTVRDANGATPLRLQPGFVDPQGRVIRLELRKQF